MAVTRANTAEMAGVSKRINAMMKEKFPAVEYKVYGVRSSQSFVIYYNDGEQKPDFDAIVEEAKAQAKGFSVGVQLLRRYYKKGIKRAFYAWEEKTDINPIV